MRESGKAAIGGWGGSGRGKGEQKKKTKVKRKPGQADARPTPARLVSFQTRAGPTRQSAGGILKKVICSN